MNDEAVAALRAGLPVVLPFDTVYGLAAEPYREEPSHRLYELKGREATQPSALVALDFDYLLECIPELRGRGASLARVLLPGPLTLILPNPGRRYRWITGSNPEAIGVRVPVLDGPGRELAHGARPATQPFHDLPPGPVAQRLQSRCVSHDLP